MIDINIDYDQAACAKVKDPEMFWPGNTPQYRLQVTQAKAVCGSCPIKTACLAHALRYEREGIWGETTPSERSAMRKKLNIPLERIY